MDFEMKGHLVPTLQKYPTICIVCIHQPIWYDGWHRLPYIMASGKLCTVHSHKWYGDKLINSFSASLQWISCPIFIEASYILIYMTAKWPFNSYLSHTFIKCIAHTISLTFLIMISFWAFSKTSASLNFYTSTVHATLHLQTLSYHESCPCTRQVNQSIWTESVNQLCDTSGTLHAWK